jgi:spore coat protein U-like protein
VNIKNNGTEGMTGRKRVLLETSEKIQLVRIGDEKTTYEVVAESSPVYNGNFKDINRGEYLVDTMDTVSVYYRLMPQQEIKKAGDYEGNVTFTVSVL